MNMTDSPLSLVAAACAAVLLAGCGGGSSDDAAQQQALAAQGKQIFRFDTFGDEAQWTDKLRMHEVISQAVDPTTALSVGLKVDSEALPAAVVQGIQNGSVDLKSPATTIALLKLDAVVGLKGTVETVNGKDTLTHVGVTCALCHSTVDNSFAPGIGKRLDGWPNRDLNPGAIIALSPAVPAATKAVYNAWGKGMYDPRFNLDGKSKPVVIPPAYGLQDIHKITLTGDGDEIAYWNRYVAVTQMGGLGTFTEPRLNLSVTNGTEDRVSDKLPALQAYQLSLAAPAAPAGSFDAAAASARQGGLRGHRPLRHLPQRNHLHRRQRHAASAERVGGGARNAQLCGSFGDQAVPHRAAQGPVAARAVFPRRLGRHAGSRGRTLQLEARAWPHAAADRRPGAVPSITVKSPEGDFTVASQCEQARRSRILPARETAPRAAPRSL